jgi:hypothetical protein
MRLGIRVGQGCAQLLDGFGLKSLYAAKQHKAQIGSAAFLRFLGLLWLKISGAGNTVTASRTLWYSPGTQLSKCG